MIVLRTIGWSVLYATIIATAVIVGRSGTPFLYQGF